jgi:hypothetical protein
MAGLYNGVYVSVERVQDALELLRHRDSSDVLAVRVATVSRFPGTRANTSAAVNQHCEQRSVVERNCCHEISYGHQRKV